jgi:hypothetical protein
MRREIRRACSASRFAFGLLPVHKTIPRAVYLFMLLNRNGSGKIGDCGKIRRIPLGILKNSTYICGV